MFDFILKQFRDKIRTNKHAMTIHAEEEMDEDGLTIFDVERVILTGEIIVRQKEHETGEWKYLIKGRSLFDFTTLCCCKI